MFYSKVSEERQQLKFEDTNLANFGTELEYKIKKEASEKEEAWIGTRENVGLRIWRIEKFKVKDWPKESYGKFYDGDSYIILHTVKQNDGTLKFKAFMWIGQFSSQDEYGTAAYKIVELDDFLGRKATLFREVQGHETNEFIALFSNKVQILSGGIESGFTHYEKPTDFPGRLFHIRRNDSIYRITQVPMKYQSINNGDVFVLDKCLQIYTFIGEKSSSYEKFKAAAFVKDLRDERTTLKAELFEINGLQDLSKEHVKKFWVLLGGAPNELSEKDTTSENKDYAKKLLNCSDESGQLKLTLLSEGKLDKSKIHSNDVFLIDTDSTLIVWIGSKSSKNEKKGAFGIASNYLVKAQRPPWITIEIINEGSEDGSFNSLFV